MSTPAESEPVRAPLTRERILRAGVEYADAHGADALSMRKLAARLGYEAMSLYNHVANKDDLLDGMVDLVAAEVELPPDDLDWKEGIRAIAIAEHEVLLRHPWAGAMVPRRFPGPARWRIAEAVLGRLTAGGFADHLRDVGYHAIILHIAGFTQQQLSYRSGGADLTEPMQRFHREVAADEFPLMVEHVRYHERADDIPGERPDEFRFVLDLILDGLERLRDA